MLEPKTVSETAVHDHVYRIFPNDLNSNNTVFGGLIMSTLDRICSVVAERHSGRVCVTASVDSMHFLEPAKHGEILIFMASINRVWRTSMEVGAKVIAEDRATGDKKHIVSAYFTFVAVDEFFAPVEIAQVIPETFMEKRRYKEAQERRELRRMEAEQRKIRRQEEQEP
ncbi:MAG TPA: acyl-CoA thioesterase [Gammaproteobacteria bacterium]|nr:acyl-CoA thioesterase [Gammaproteobacteria bacterium]